MSSQMIPTNQTTYDYVDYLNGRFSFPEDSSGYERSAFSGLSDLQMRGMYDGTESIVADLFTDAHNHISPSRTESPTDPFEPKDYDSLIDISGLCQYGGPGKERLDTSVWNHWTPAPETAPTGTYMKMECQPSEMLQQSHGFQQAVHMNNANEFQPNVKGKTAASGLSATPLKTMPKKWRSRSKEANLRFTMNERLQALREQLPASFENSKRDSVLDNAMIHIKQLELQLKLNVGLNIQALSATKLGGEPISTPLIFLEGHGHYYPHDLMFEESLEEVLGNLIEENPTAAWKLFESKGLYMMPISSVDALREAE